ncbi:hypothetical protein [Vibrio owensii]|uniref:hypothetical protein n=1 Tax=Vibrio owensii TaxID=696485 RepID=UPI0018F14A28|nr:hypothetical protein [Vibrio owensii]
MIDHNEYNEVSDADLMLVDAAILVQANQKSSCREPIEPVALKHGAIYTVEDNFTNVATEARCNISTEGDEIWFTNRKGEIVSGKAIQYLRPSDSAYKNYDVATFENDSERTQRAHRDLVIPTENGYLSVPATNATDEFPYLAVTMTTFGKFEITHTPSGHQMLKGFERAINAFIAMANLQLAINELGIDASLGKKEFHSLVTKNNEICECLNMPLKQWLYLQTTVRPSTSEFLWESPTDGPNEQFNRLVEKLKRQ